MSSVYKPSQAGTEGDEIGTAYNHVLVSGVEWMCVDVDVCCVDVCRVDVCRVDVHRVDLCGVWMCRVNVWLADVCTA